MNHPVVECSVSECSRPVQVRRRQLCKRHYEQQRRAGAFDPRPAAPEESEISFATDHVDLGDLDGLIRSRGLDPDQWIVVSTSINQWDAPLKDGGTQTMQQTKVTLRRSPQAILALAAEGHVAPLRRSRRVVKQDKPELIVVESDSQIPYLDPDLHQASLYAIEELYRRHNLTEQVFLGDVGDYPTISKHPDHPAAMATVNEVIQGSYDYLRAKAEAAPNARRRLLKGNHDWRLESELLNRAERLYGIAPASTDGSPEIPALSLTRLLHLEELGIELVEDPRGWEHGEVELVQGTGGLVCRHGWLTGANTAERSMLKRGRSIIVGHTHQREHVFRWDPSAGIERQAAVIGAMSLARDQAFPHFTVLDNWTQGFGIVTRWPDGAFQIEHAIWNGETLRWRDRQWS